LIDDAADEDLLQPLREAELPGGACQR
jgi:hypothetical protein